MPGVDQLRREGHLAPDLPMRKQKLLLLQGHGRTAVLRAWLALLSIPALD